MSLICHRFVVFYLLTHYRQTGQTAQQIEIFFFFYFLSPLLFILLLFFFLHTSLDTFFFLPLSLTPTQPFPTFYNSWSVAETTHTLLVDLHFHPLYSLSLSHSALLLNQLAHSQRNQKQESNDNQLPTGTWCVLCVHFEHQQQPQSRRKKKKPPPKKSLKNTDQILTPAGSLQKRRYTSPFLSSLLLLFLACYNVTVCTLYVCFACDITNRIQEFGTRNSWKRVKKVREQSYRRARTDRAG